MADSEDVVLIVAEEEDFHARAVARVLETDHDVTPFQLCTEQFPDAAVATYGAGGASTASFVDESSRLDFDRVRSVWWRRPRDYEAPDHLDEPERSFREAEVNHFLQGLLWRTEARWINPPAKTRLAARKVVQLSRAEAVDLPVPDTVITNDPAEAEEFIESTTGRVIYKRTGTHPGPFSKTSFVSEETLDRLDTIRESPTTFQEYVEPGYDVRITWIDGEAWPVRIDTAASDVPEDSRLDYSVPHEPYSLPDGVERKVRALIDELGLRFAAVDLRVSPDGTHYFLELNPAGQFIYLELLTDQPLTEAFAQSLAR